MIDDSDNSSFDHKGLHDFWASGGADHSGIQPNFAKVLRLLLAHLAAARSFADIQSGLALLKKLKPLAGQTDRYEMQINGNYRLTFSCPDKSTGKVVKLNIEDVHRPSGAKRY
ncbi:type II toxin-antitoxin system RelE/ParE family toxin [Pseudoduganella sp. OTU4001]|uniref:type II toxin-antitoxin system RelE/ParE family toxin n=1 Tax=Pseudoduganella sp. OTU4001 TaxID=3043854 RepID=UPI00313CAB1F